MDTYSEKNRICGKIKEYKTDRGFGFIEADKDYFFHISQFKENNTIPEKGMDVSFIPAKNDKGTYATNIKLRKISQGAPNSFEDVFKLNSKGVTTEKKSSKVKAAGLKSAFIVDSENALLTSFGKGNSAIIEKEIAGDKLFDVEKNFSAILNDKKIDIISAVNGLAPNPLKSDFTGETVIYSKSALEQQFYGKTFDDNIHIQIIYNILDIKKILAVHTNNIVYALNNIRRSDNEKTDFIGESWIKLDVKKNDKNNGKSDYEMYHDWAIKGAKDKFTYDDFQQFLNNDRLAYFGNAFYKLSEKGKMVKRSEQEIYYIIAILREMRNACVHSPEFNYSYVANIYNLENRLNSEAKQVLNAIYDEKINTIDAKTFVNNNCSKNFHILFSAMSADSAEQKIEIAKNLYNFSMKKTYKNIGFSIKKMREYMLDIYGSELKNDSVQMNSVRSKAYQLVDFVIWDYYNKNSEKTDSIVSELRTALTDEENHLVYYNNAKQLYAEIKNQIDVITEKIKNITNPEYHISDKKFKENIENAISGEAFIKSDKVSWFSKMIYLLTLFLDGKEINDLLTTLINKFDNIASLSAVAKCRFEKAGKTLYVEQYSLFSSDNLLRLKKDKIENSPENYECIIVEELRNINSFARMTKDIEVKRSAFEEAAFLLGADFSKDDLNDLMYYLDSIVLKNRVDEIKKQRNKGKHIDTAEYDDLKSKLACIDYKKLPNEKIDSGMRNFIINNVIQSKRFNYIVRYADPYKIKGCIKNRSLVEFVFRDIPDAQIDRYYKACRGSSCSTRKDKVNYLVGLICDFNYIDLKDVNQKAKQTDPDKQQKRTIVSLYLNVLYQIAKNLVYINSRYVIAFHCLERDNILFNKETDDYFSIANEVIKKNKEKAVAAYNEDKKQIPLLKEKFGYSDNAEHPVKKYETRIEKKYADKIRVNEYLNVNIANADKYALNAFRNTVAHLNAIRDVSRYVNGIKNVSSYFQLYHYVIQISFEKLGEHNERVGYYVSKTKSSGVYSKDFVKALCSPFTYNLPRFKNLSIDELFDMNDTRKN